uniref:Small ribosomal subunit protein mS39 n=1 Tax=Denticeps clupeoides TaxID=299321 RepID=A0AAY4BR48_9TELE
MASSCAHAGRCVYRTRRVFLPAFEHWRCRRTFAWTTSLSQEAAVANEGSAEDIVIPKKKSWSKEAVLQALASTVSRDPTAAQYIFQDDPFLTPRTPGEFKLYSLSQESGRNAAKYFVDTYPKFFQKDFAEPHIPCLMPESVQLQIDEVSEAALVERIELRKVKAAVDLYDQLLQAGTKVSLDVTNNLLDLICLYGDQDPKQENEPEQRKEDTAQDDVKTRKGRLRKASDLLKPVWRENNSAERIFSLMPERNAHSYSALVRGMVKVAITSPAFNTYTDLLNNRLTADVHIFNALISAAPDMREKYNERWDLILDLLKQMSEQKVKPNMLTFNAVLKALKRCGPLARSQSLLVIGEMKALGIASPAHGHTEILQDVLNELSGKSFHKRLLAFASIQCLDNKDMEQAYRVHHLLGEGENWRLLGDSYQQSIYYGRFFNLLCMMEHIDVVLKWYRELIPSLYYPNSHGMQDLLQALDTDSRLDLIPLIWKGGRIDKIKCMYLRSGLCRVVQESFAECALDVKSLYVQGERARPLLEWTATSLGNITSILLSAHKRQQAWEMLQLFKDSNRVPSESLMLDFLSSIKDSNDAGRAVELLRLSASFCLAITPKLIEQVQQEFVLSEDQK